MIGKSLSTILSNLPRTLAPARNAFNWPRMQSSANPRHSARSDLTAD